MPPPRIIYSGSNSTRKRNKKVATSVSSLPFILQVLAACCCGLFFLLLPLHLTLHVNAEQHSTIPRSNNRYTHYTNSISSTDTDDSKSSSSSSPSSSSASDISSISSPLNKESSSYHPPWNPSPKINPHGFLSEYYPRTPGEWETLANIRGKHGPRNYARYQKLLNIPVQIRQVPGDGNCLFHSIAATLYYMNHNCNAHLPMDSHASINELRSLSLALRNSAVDVLANENNINGRRKLFLQGEEYLEAHELLNAAAAQFDLDGEGYCELMRKESYWGGGPEIVALCNYLQRPIHIYELIPSEEVSTQDDNINNNNNLPSTYNNIKTSNQFTLRRMACFGSPKFDRREPLHILSADSRFPDVEPRRIRKVGNHFLALFPVNTLRHNNGAEEDGQYYQQQQRFRRHALIRGGSRIEGDKNNRDKVSNNRSGDDNERNTKGSGNNDKRNNIWQFLGEFIWGFTGGAV